MSRDTAAVTDCVNDGVNNAAGDGGTRDAADAAGNDDDDAGGAASKKSNPSCMCRLLIDAEDAPPTWLRATCRP